MKKHNMFRVMSHRYEVYFITTQDDILNPQTTYIAYGPYTTGPVPLLGSQILESVLI